MPGTAIAKRDVNAIVADVQSDAFMEQIEQSLPEGVSAKRFVQIAVTAIRTKPELQECSENSLFAAIVRCAQDGLLADGREAAIVKRGQGDKAEASYMPMIGGFRKVAAEYGWTIRTKAVYKADEFSFTDSPPTINHRQSSADDRGDLVAAYAIATHRDGRREQTVMLPADIEARHALAKTENVWKQWPAQMWEKTAGRELFAELPLSETDKRVASMIDATAIPAEQATALMYGTEDRPALPPSAVAGAEPVPGTSSAPSAPPRVFTAEEAATFVPPTGVHGAAGRTLAEIKDLGRGGGAVWFSMALHKEDLDPTFRSALLAYAKAELPDVYAEVAPAEQAEEEVEL